MLEFYIKQLFGWCEFDIEPDSCQLLFLNSKVDTFEKVWNNKRKKGVHLNGKNEGIF